MRSQQCGRLGGGCPAKTIRLSRPNGFQRLKNIMIDLKQGKKVLSYQRDSLYEYSCKGFVTDF